MVELFGIDIAALVDENLSDGVLDATLTKFTPGTRTPSDLASGTNPTPEVFTAKGFIEDYTDRDFENTQIEIGDRRITLIANSIQNMAIPETGDRVFIEGESWNIKRVKRDPAAATYLCQARQ